MLAIFCTKDDLIKKYECLSKIQNTNTSEKIFENGTENYVDWCFSKEVFAGFILKDFEDYKFYIPQQYHEYLSTAYGDYMELPPIEERENRHLIVEVNFGEKDN